MLRRHLLAGAQGGEFFTESLCVEAWITALRLLSTVQMSRGTMLELVPEIKPVSPRSPRRTPADRVRSRRWCLDRVARALFLSGGAGTRGYRPNKKRRVSLPYFFALLLLDTASEVIHDPRVA